MLAKDYPSLLPRSRSVRRKPKRLASQRLYVLTGLPRVGPHTAKCLLKHFGTVERCIMASEEELCAVHGIGSKTAQQIRRVLTTMEGELPKPHAAEIV